MQADSRVPVLDLLRLVAVLGVVLFHYGFRGPNGIDAAYTALPELASIGRYGFLGVPVFFVISGFVIAYSAEGRTATGFAIARFARIYPTFVFCMTLTFAALLFFGPPHFQTSAAQWVANLTIAAPGHTYMDSAYWSLVVEVIFYAWVTVFIGLGLFQRSSDLIVALWLGVSLLNELTYDFPWIGKLLLADYSGFFATGILIYQLHKGRRDLWLQGLLAASVATAVFQAVHNLRWLRAQTGDMFDEFMVAAIFLGSVLVILLATRIRSLPIRPAVVIAIGGTTYPFYLLHQQFGYVIFQKVGPAAEPFVLVVAIVGLVFAMSWATWRFVERPAQRFTKQALTGFAAGISVRAASRSRELPSNL